MTNHNQSAHGGARLPKSKPPGKCKRWLHAHRMLFLILGFIVAILTITAVLIYKLLFIKPELPDPSHPVAKPGNSTEVVEYDYGDGIRPKSDGERKSEDFYTILVLGRDTGGGGNTDTILLASYDVTNQKATVMSIPRDTMVNVNWDVKKINSVYNWYGGGDRGIQAVYQEIAQLIGFQPDYQVVVEWEAVGAIVDAIGGVYFDVPYNMDYDDPQQDLHIHQEKGYRKLSGDDAMQVIRWRKNNSWSSYGHTSGVGDAGRIQIQQNFLAAVLSQLLQIKNVTNLNKLATIFQENVSTDLTLQNILWFGQQALLGGLKTEDVTFVTMPYDGANVWSRTYKQDLSYLVPRSKELLALVNESLSPFTEEFTLRDLDIMSVNADGSVSSSTGHVEDTQATYPKSHWQTQVTPSQTTTDKDHVENTDNPSTDISPTPSVTPETSNPEQPTHSNSTPPEKPSSSSQPSNADDIPPNNTLPDDTPSAEPEAPTDSPELPSSTLDPSANTSEPSPEPSPESSQEPSEVTPTVPPEENTKPSPAPSPSEEPQSTSTPDTPPLPSSIPIPGEEIEIGVVPIS